MLITTEPPAARVPMFQVPPMVLKAPVSYCTSPGVILVVAVDIDVDGDDYVLALSSPLSGGWLRLGSSTFVIRDVLNLGD